METPLIVLLIIFLSICVVGMTGNIIMVLATIHSRNLRSICNILICICCFFDLLIFTSILVFIHSMLIPMTQEVCYYATIPGDFGAFASNGCLLAVGFDRLLAVRNPALYKFYELDKPKYIARILSLPIIYSIILLYIGFTERDPTRYVACLVPESLGVAYKIFALTSFIMILFVPPVYGYVFWKIRQIQMSTSAKSVFRSLFITVVLVICGWMTTDLLGFLTVIISMDPKLATWIQLYCGIFALGSSACNVFVYYNISKDYRQAIRSLFRIKNDNKEYNTSVGTLKPTPRNSVHQNGAF